MLTLNSNCADVDAQGAASAAWRVPEKRKKVSNGKKVRANRQIYPRAETFLLIRPPSNTAGRVIFYNQLCLLQLRSVYRGSSILPFPIIIISQCRYNIAERAAALACDQTTFCLHSLWAC
jgi:hypothetical protein